MEADEQNIGNNLKRQRAPLSDSEDNIPTASEEKDVQKRRRMDAVGQENHSPTQGNHPVTGPKQDTPIVPSVQSRVQQLTQRRGGTSLTQRCLSDPGADSPATIIQDKGFREQLLGEGEFSQRMEKFKVPVCKSDSASSPANPFFRTCSNFVSGIHQKLQDSPTSSEQASRIRQEREKEFSRLHFQPIRENPWLKRSSSDSSLNQQGRTPPGSSSPSSWVPRSKKRVQWPPTQPLDVDADADMKDGSFTQAPTLDAKKPSIHTTGEVTACDSEDPTTSSIEGQLQMECKKKNNCQDCQEVRQKGKDGEEESQNLSYDDRSLLYSMCPEESDMKKACEHSNVAAQSESEVLSLDEKKNIDCLYSDEETEPSTDEELRFWRYPQDKVYKEEDFVIADLQKDECAKRREQALVLSSGKNETGGCVDDCDPSDIQGGECSLSRVSAEIYSSKLHKDNGEEDAYDNSYEACCSGAAIEDSHIFTIRQGQKNTEECPHVDEICQDSNKMQTDLGLESVRTGLNSEVKEMKASAFSDVMQFLKETPRGHRDLQRNTEDVTQPEAEVSPQQLCIDIHDAQSVTETLASEHILETEGMDQEEVDESQDLTDVLTKETHQAEGKESSKRVFFLEPELINETNNSVESRIETSTSDVEFSSHDETNTAEIIDQMFDEVLEYAGRIEEDRSDDEDTEDRDSGIVACPGDKTDLESEKEESQEGTKEACDELLTFPPSGILSPLSKSVEAVVTPMRLAVSQESNPLFLLTPQETTTPPAESAPLYSIDAYRTQRQSKLPTIQSITPGVQRRAPEKSQTQQSVNTKERIMTLNEEAVKLQTVINQTLQALCCCTDEEHGQGSLQEAEAEKLLLVSCEKRSALLVEVARLREERNSESGEAARDDREYVSQQPCRGTVSITNIQLPLKVEFVCSSHSRTGRQSHYFFVLVRYGPCNIVATQLATAADAQNGDTISFATSVTLKDIRSSFEIDVEVYSLSHTSSNNCGIDRATTKSRVTPRKLLNTITRSSNTLASAAPSNLSARRSSNFSLVGCHKITLASLGHSKFPLDKMKLEGKIRRLLGDEFQEKVPFLSPLEGNIYLKLHSESHSNVQHQGFLTMFELISGYGVWHRCFFVLEKCNMYYWNHPNDKETKEAEGIIGLSSSPSQCVRPVKKDSCARPFTFELVSNIPHQQQDDSQEAIAKCWFSADTKEERLDWMAKLNQAILDFHTWSSTTSIYTESGQPNTSSSGVHEDMLEVALK